jgi:hypothetical protein
MRTHMARVGSTTTRIINAPDLYVVFQPGERSQAGQVDTAMPASHPGGGRCSLATPRGWRW